jgi:hypothetical protein
VEFLIADTFTDSLTRLTADEQRAVKTAAFDLQINPANPGLSLERLTKPKDKHFWSVRGSRDIRLIVHRTESSFLLCYVDHHEAAFGWAERRRLETHPKTGAAQLVEVRERVEEILVPRYVEVDQPAPPKPRIFAGVSEDRLLSYGVPVEWLDAVRQVTEDSMLDLSDHLPREAVEALLDLATGATPQIPPQITNGEDPFKHPDAQRRYHVIETTDELARALEYPWEKWMVFLHPAQRESVERDYGGAARIAGTAGTGKTIVALHRAVFLARTKGELDDVGGQTLRVTSASVERRLAANAPVGEPIKPLGAWAILALASSDVAFRAHVAARLSRWEQSRARRRLEDRGCSKSRRGCVSAE